MSKEKNVNRIQWDGQMPTGDFVKMTRKLGYKYLLESVYKEGTAQILACRNCEELADMLELFSNNGFSCTVSRLFHVNDDVLNKLQISQKEFHFICGEFNGSVIDLSELNIANEIVYKLEDNYFNKTDAYIDVLIRKIQKMSYRNLLELLCEVDEYWSKGNSDYIEFFGRESARMILNKLKICEM